MPLSLPKPLLILHVLLSAVELVWRYRSPIARVTSGKSMSTLQTWRKTSEATTPAVRQTSGWTESSSSNLTFHWHPLTQRIPQIRPLRTVYPGAPPTFLCQCKHRRPTLIQGSRSVLRFRDHSSASMLIGQIPHRPRMFHAPAVMNKPNPARQIVSTLYFHENAAT